MPHAARPPRACNPSSSDRNGKRKATAETRPACKGAAGLPRSARAEKETFDLPFQFAERRRQHAAAGIDNHSALRTQYRETGAHSLPDSPLDPVADHRVAQRARHRDAHLGPPARFIKQNKSQQRGARVAGAALIDGTELAGTQNPDTFGKTRDERLPFGADGKLVPSFGPAPRQDGPAVLGLHPNPEAVSFGAFAIVGLIRTFRHCALSPGRHKSPSVPRLESVKNPV